MTFKKKILAFILLLTLTTIAESANRYVVPVADRGFNQTALYYCSLEMGKTEMTGRNDGKHVEAYLKVCGLNQQGRYPYCAAAQAYCTKLACDSLDIANPFGKYSASANWHYDHARKIGMKCDTNAPEIGDLIIWKNQNNYNGHIERVFEILPKYRVKTYAFNTSNGKTGSQREGNGNFIRERCYKSFLGRMRLRGFVGFSAYCKIN